MSLQVAIVGMGNIGNRHAQVYQKRSDAKIVAVCDIIQEKADRAAERYGCPAFYSVQDMLASGIQIDAASMCTAGVENGGEGQHLERDAATERHLLRLVHDTHAAASDLA